MSEHPLRAAHKKADAQWERLMRRAAELGDRELLELMREQCVIDAEIARLRVLSHPAKGPAN
jgi:hypothetical protein